MALAADRTRRVTLYPAVTNPVTRHPMVLASIAQSLEEIAPHRVILCIGAGFMSTRHINRGSASVNEMREAVDQARRLLDGENVYPGITEGKLVHTSDPPTPVYVCATGPRMIELAGENSRRRNAHGRTRSRDGGRRHGPSGQGGREGWEDSRGHPYHAGLWRNPGTGSRDRAGTCQARLLGSDAPSRQRPASGAGGSGMACRHQRPRRYTSPTCYHASATQPACSATTVHGRTGLTPQEACRECAGSLSSPISPMNSPKASSPITGTG